MDAHAATTSGTLDEAWERLHATGPEYAGRLSNHAPMAVESLVRHGRSGTVHRWLDTYRERLEDVPARTERVTDDNWQEALGDPRRLTDWDDYFTRRIEERPWRDVLAEWWPRLLPGISASATHPVIRTGHAVRALYELDEAGPRRAELAQALGYWAARYLPLTGITPLRTGATGQAAQATQAGQATQAALEAVPRIGDQSGSIVERLSRISALPERPGPSGPGPEDVRAALGEIVRAATLRYGTHGHGEPVMLVHAATAPNAVLRVLPALPHELWAPSLDAAWSAAAAITAAYAPTTADPASSAASSPAAAPAPAPTRVDAEEVFARAAAHGDAHVVKFADTALDVATGSTTTGAGSAAEADDEQAALGAALRAVELIEPFLPAR